MTLVGAGIVNLMTAVDLIQRGAEVEILEASPDPRTRPPWQRLGATHGGANARMFCFTEADNYNEKGHRVYAKMRQVFRQTISHGGWMAEQPEELDGHERAWIERFHALPRWRAEVFTEDIHGFTISSYPLWKRLRETSPRLFEGVGYTAGILRLYAEAEKAEAARALHARLGSLTRTLDNDELVRRHPACREAVTDGWIAGALEVRGFTLNIHDFVSRLLTFLEEQGAGLSWDRPVTALERTPGGRVSGLITGGGTVRSDHYVLSPGVYGGSLLDGTRTAGKIQGILGLWTSFPNLEPRLRHSIKIHREGHVGEDSNVTLGRDEGGRPILILGSGYGYLGSRPLDMGSPEIARLFEALEETARALLPPRSSAGAGRRHAAQRPQGLRPALHLHRPRGLRGRRHGGRRPPGDRLGAQHRRLRPSARGGGGRGHDPGGPAASDAGPLRPGARHPAGLLHGLSLRRSGAVARQPPVVLGPLAQDEKGNMLNVNSYNEWDPLREVIVGLAQDVRYPRNDLSMNALQALDQGLLPEVEKAYLPEIPQWIVDEAEEDLEIFVEELEKLDIVVKRPEPIDGSRSHRTPAWECEPFYNYSARDLLLVVGDTIIETPAYLRSRHFETQSYRDLLLDYFGEGCHWICAPKPRLRDGDYDLTPGTESILPEFEPIFDAANIARCGRDLFYLVSNSGNALGAQWLQRTLGSEYRVHPVQSMYAGSHIDTTIVPLRPGLVLVNPARANDSNLPEILKQWEVLASPDMVDYSYSDVEPLTSKWLGMNLLMLSPDLAVVDSHQKTPDRPARELRHRHPSHPAEARQDHERGLSLRHPRHPPNGRPRGLFRLRRRRAFPRVTQGRDYPFSRAPTSSGASIPCKRHERCGSGSPSTTGTGAMRRTWRTSTPARRRGPTSPGPWPPTAPRSSRWKRTTGSSSG